MLLLRYVPSTNAVCTNYTGPRITFTCYYYLSRKVLHTEVVLRKTKPLLYKRCVSAYHMLCVQVHRYTRSILLSKIERYVFNGHSYTWAHVTCPE